MRWHAGAAPTSDLPALAGLRLWDDEQRFSDVDADYCRKACGGVRCASCPAPTLLPEAMPAVVAYTLAQTQWRTGAVGRTGLDYPACAWTWATYRARAARDGVPPLPPDEELLDHVAVIEHAYLHSDSERAASDRAHRERRAIGSSDDTMGV